MASNPSPNAAAILVWLPKGATPTIHTFSASATQGHPTIQPVAYWLLSEAMHVAETDENHPNDEPWIKAGEALLNRQQIHDLYGAAMAFTKSMKDQQSADGA